MPLPEHIVQALAPTGVLRASINLGNPILAGRDTAGEPAGVSVDLARAFAQQLGVALELMVWDSAGKSVDCVAAEEADIGFFAIDPKRGTGIRFTDAYVLIEGAYLVRTDSPLQDAASVDASANRVMVAAGSAYDLFLSRELKHAQVVRTATSAAVVEAFLEQNVEVAAGIKPMLEAQARARTDLRLLPESFMVIRQAMGLPKSRGEAAATTLADFIEDMKASDFVAQALQRHGIQGAAVAPPAPRVNVVPTIVPGSTPTPSMAADDHYRPLTVIT